MRGPTRIVWAGLTPSSLRSVIAGAMEPEHVSRTVDTMNAAVPAKLWEDLKDAGVLPEACPTP